MPCDNTGAEFGYRQDDHTYGPILYMHEKRREILKAGGILAAVRDGIVDANEMIVLSLMQPTSHVQSSVGIHMELLCYVCTRASRGDSWADIIAGNPDLETWFQLHQKFDSARIAAEEAKLERKNAKAAAMAKLTPQERALLGFNEAI